jgi:tetratricopeptide (TPR) repeat protein
MDYLEHPEATWDSERSNALRIIGLCWEQYREYDRAVSFLVRSISEFPKCRELWYELGRFFHDREDWEGAIWALKKALSFTERNPNWIGNVRNAWTDKPKNLLVTAEQKK